MAPKRKGNAKGVPKSRKAKVEEVPDAVAEDSLEGKAEEEKKQDTIIAEVEVDAEEPEVTKKPENETEDPEKEEKAEERATEKEDEVKVTEPSKTKRRGGRRKAENDTEVAEKEEKAEVKAMEKEGDLTPTEPTKRKRKGGKKKAENETEDSEEAGDKALEKEEDLKPTEPAKPKSRAGKKKEAPTVIPGTKRVTRANPGPKEEVILKEKEPPVAEDEVVLKTSSKAHIIIEHCKQCQSIKTRALKVEESLKAANPDLIISINPEKPRKGCFEIRDEHGRVFVSLLNMPRPFKKLKDLDLDATVHDILEELN